MNTFRALSIATALAPGTAMAALFGSLLAGTPPTDLGVRDGRLAPCPAKPNCVSSQATDDEHRIAPIAFRGSASDAIVRLAGVIAAQDGATIVKRGDAYVYATFTTPIMGFVDDVEFSVDPARHVIDVRSASRLGHSDLGVNRKRIEQLRAAFAEAGA
ncbi:MAG: DUF1499 domain-containing protein [Burkholderiales bacterium]